MYPFGFVDVLGEIARTRWGGRLVEYALVDG